MTPRRYGPLAYVPIHRRPPLSWPNGARVALWVNPNVEFFGLDDVMPSNLNERVPRDQAKIPNVRNWAVRDYGDRVGIWRLMEVLTRYGIRASAALNSEVCDHHPEIIEEGGKLGWEWIGHNQTNALRLSEMDPAAERAAVRATIDRIEAASGTRPLGWLGAGRAETWNTLDYLAEAGIRYVCDWVNDDQPCQFEIGTPPLVSLSYSVQTNDPQPWADLPKVLELARRPNAVIKVSGACTLSREPYPFQDIWDPVARVFDAWGFERCLWARTGRAFAVVNYEQAVEPFRKTDRLSDTDG